MLTWNKLVWDSTAECILLHGSTNIPEIANGSICPSSRSKPGYFQSVHKTLYSKLLTEVRPGKLFSSRFFYFFGFLGQMLNPFSTPFKNGLFYWVPSLGTSPDLPKAERKLFFSTQYSVLPDSKTHWMCNVHWMCASCWYSWAYGFTGKVCELPFSPDLRLNLVFLLCKIFDHLVLMWIRWKCIQACCVSSRHSASEWDTGGRDGISVFYVPGNENRLISQKANDVNLIVAVEEKAENAKSQAIDFNKYTFNRYNFP